MLQKTYCKDFLNGKRRKNNGEAPRYWAERTHPVIIDEELFDKVQEEIERRKELGYKANQSISFSCFTSKVICANCGRTYRKRIGEATRCVTRYYRWKCGGKVDHTSSFCDATNIADKVLYSITSDVLEKENFTDEDFNKAIDHIVVSKPNKLTFHMKDGSTIEKIFKGGKNAKSGNNNTGNAD